MTTLSKNLLFNVAGQGLVLILSFIAVKFIYKQLGDDVFGIIYFNITLATVLTTVLELGVLSTTTREVSRSYDSDPGYITTLIQTGSLLYWGIGVLLLVSIFAAAPLLVANWINLRTLDQSTAATLIRVLSVGTMVALPRAFYTSIFRGRQRMAANNIIDVLTAIAQQLGIVVLLRLGGSAFAVAAWISIGTLLSIVIYVVKAGRMFGWRSLEPRFHLSVVRRNRAYTTQMMANSMLALVHTQSDKVVVSKLLPVAAFGVYGFASATVGRAMFITVAVGQAAFASFASLSETGDPDVLNRQFRKLQDLICLLTPPVFAAVIFGARPAYTYLFNGGVAAQLLLPTIFLALGFYLNSCLNLPFMLAFATGKPMLIARTNFIALFIPLPITVALVASLGINGAAFSWLFYNLFVAVFAIPGIYSECLSLPGWGWYSQVLKAFGLALIVYGLGWLLIAQPGSYSFLSLVEAYAAGSILFAGGAYLLMGPDLRETFVRLPGLLAARKAPVG